MDVVREIAAETKKTPSQVSLNWMLRQGITSPLVGARTVAQLEENIGALDFTLTDEQFKRLNTVSSNPEPPFPHHFRGVVEDFVTGGHTVARPHQYSKFF